MKVFVYLLFFCLFFQFSQAQYFLNGGYSYLIKHSENDAPTILEKGFKGLATGGIGTSFELGGHKHLQLAASYGELIERFYLRIEQNGRIRVIEEYGYLLEQTLPVSLRLFFSKNSISGYGFGPLLLTTKQTYVNRLGYSPLREIVYIQSAGFSLFYRLAQSLSSKLYVMEDIEINASKSISVKGGGQDLSNYSHNTLQLRVSVGLGHR